MGHVRVGFLPKYPKWKLLSDYIEDEDVSPDKVASQVLRGTQDVLLATSAESSLAVCFWLLASLTAASTDKAFTKELSNLGIEIPDEASATLFITRTSRIAADHLADIRPHSAVNNLAELAFRETLTKSIGPHLQTLFGARLEDVQLGLRRYSSGEQFGKLSHVFFSAFLRRVMRYVVDKEISNHLGRQGRFRTLTDLEDFAEELDGFAGQTAQIITQFAGDWFARRVWLNKGVIDQSTIRGFVHVALGKMHADLHLSEVQDA